MKKVASRLHSGESVRENAVRSWEDLSSKGVKLSFIFMRGWPGWQQKRRGKMKRASCITVGS